MLLTEIENRRLRWKRGLGEWLEGMRLLAMTDMKRIFDLILDLVLIALFSIPMLVIAVLIKTMSKGPVIFWTDRVGMNNSIFKMAKFRTMKLNTPQVATHLMKNPKDYLIPGGEFLRKYSFDELPQLFNVLKGDMSFVGPRPALFNQDDLVELRTKKNIHKLVPGVTGWAQVNGRDDLAIPVKVSFDEYYLKHRSFVFDLYIIFLTAIKVVKREGVRH
jgi:O-antigen biosynthesis protein WbqP